MSKVIVSRDLAFPVAEVWSVLADFGGIHRFSAGVESSPINTGTPATGLGAERNCRLYDGNHIQERVTEFVENERLGIVIFDTSMPLRSAQGRFELLPMADGGTQVTMIMEYVVRYGLIGRAMDAIMMRRMMTATLERLLHGLDEHITTGEPIERGWKPSLAA